MTNIFKRFKTWLTQDADNWGILAHHHYARVEFYWTDRDNNVTQLSLESITGADAIKSASAWGYKPRTWWNPRTWNNVCLVVSHPNR